MSGNPEVKSIYQLAIEQMLVDLFGDKHNVEKFYYDTDKQKWVITYKNGLTPDQFDDIHDLYVFAVNDAQG